MYMYRNFLYQTPKTSIIRLTPRIGCKTPGQSVMLMPSGSGGIKRTMTAVLQLSDEDTDDRSTLLATSSFSQVWLQFFGNHL